LSTEGLEARKQQRLGVSPDNNPSNKRYGNLKSQGSLAAKISTLKYVY
jgi:hypothetical protein